MQAWRHTRSTAHSATVSMDKKQLNRLTASLNFGNMFCALAFITFAAMVTQGDPEWIYQLPTYHLNFHRIVKL